MVHELDRSSDPSHLLAADSAAGLSLSAHADSQSEPGELFDRSKNGKEGE